MSDYNPVRYNNEPKIKTFIFTPDRDISSFLNDINRYIVDYTMRGDFLYKDTQYIYNEGKLVAVTVILLPKHLYNLK